MARLPRLAIAGEMHHVLQRGHNRQDVFVDDTDREQFLRAVREAAAASRTAVHAYVLMDNHVHLVLTPESTEGLSRMMQAVGRRYVPDFNRRHGRVGTLWDSRFRATVVERDRHGIQLMQYVESNPVRSGRSTTADQWRWSSARHHLGIERNPLITDSPVYWALGNTPFDREVGYRAGLERGLSAREIEAITVATLKGWALGSPQFVARLAERTERPLIARRRGRPPKATLSPIDANPESKSG